MPRHVLLPPGVVVGRLNRLLTGWANYFTLGQVSPQRPRDRLETACPTGLQFVCKGSNGELGRYLTEFIHPPGPGAPPGAGQPRREARLVRRIRGRQASEEC